MGQRHEDAVPQAHRREAARATTQHHLGPPEEEEAVLAQRVLQARDHERLRLRIEIHQGVAAGGQVDAGDRGIPGQVEAPEDDGPTQRRRDHPAPPPYVGLEVGLAQVFWDVVQRLLGVDGGACLGQGVEVDVGGVDLHAPLAVSCGPRWLAMIMARVKASSPVAHPALHSRIS